MQRFPLVFAAALLAGGLILSTPAMAAGPFEATLARAETVLERGDAPGALALLARLDGQLRHDGDIARHASLTCRAHYDTGAFSAAVDACSAAIDTRAAHWSDYNNRAAAFLALGETDAAIADLRQANTMRPGLAVVRRNLARATALQASENVVATRH